MFAKSISALTATSLVIGLFAAPVFADAYNPDMNVSFDDLASACDASGGEMTLYNDGSYGCVTERADGSVTVISCDADESCFGSDIGIQGRKGRKADAFGTSGTMKAAPAAKRAGVSRSKATKPRAAKN